jgi:uncharacterized membrane protein YbhN (UPF0104 family)
MLGVKLYSLTFYFLYRELSHYYVKDIFRQIGLISIDQVAVVLLVAATGFEIMTIYDLLVLRYLKQTLAFGKIARPALCRHRLQQQRRPFYARRRLSACKDDLNPYFSNL